MPGPRPTRARSGRTPTARGRHGRTAPWPIRCRPAPRHRRRRRRRPAVSARIDRPAVDGGPRGDHVAGGAGGRMHDRAAIAHQGVDQAALADVRAAGHDDVATARPDAGPAGRGPRGRRSALGPRPIADHGWLARIASMARRKRPVVLVQEDRGGPHRCGPRPRQAARRRRSGRRLPRRPTPATAAAGSPRRRGPARSWPPWRRPPWQCTSTDRAERQRTTTSSPGSSPNRPMASRWSGWGLSGPSVAGVEVGGDRRGRPRALRPATGHGPAARRRQ